jgi:hypothetical protein
LGGCWTRSDWHARGELIFRHFYGLRRFSKGVDRPYGAVVGVLRTVLGVARSGM